MSPHRCPLFIRGKGALRLVSDTGINSTKTVPVNKAK